MLEIRKRCSECDDDLGKFNWTNICDECKTKEESDRKKAIANGEFMVSSQNIEIID